MDQTTRLIPRRLLAEIVSTSLPSESKTSSLIGPKRWRVRWYHAIAAPPAGFWPTKLASPSGHPPLAGIRCWAGRPGRNTASRPSTSCVRPRKGVKSSMIQMPRPCVAITRSPSRGCTWISRTATLGKLPPLNSAQVAPESGEIQRPYSVPTKSRPRSTASSLMTWAYPRTPCSGPTIRFQVFPKSAVR